MDLSALTIAALLLADPAPPAPSAPDAKILLAPDASPREVLAAREVQRYVYLRAGRLLPIVPAPAAPTGDAIIVARKDRPILAAALPDPAATATIASLGPQQFMLKTVDLSPGTKVLVLAGGDDIGTLYAAYRFAERLGVRFAIDGDAVPDGTIPLDLSGPDEVGRPLFELRGLLPFHDFPEGPDWWSRDEWKSVIAQAAKLRLNFIGLHTYPKGALGPEPTVWIGLPEDCEPDGTVRTSDATSWHNTQRFTDYGCYRPEKTNEFSFGAAEVFEADDFGPEINGPDDFPVPRTPEGAVALMNRAGSMLRDVFAYARGMGFRTCAGTEGPLNIPESVKKRLADLKLDPADPATVERLYEGMFLRIARAYPIDHYWIWGHEGEIDPGAFLKDLRCALSAAKKARAPFGMAICGWGWITSNFPALDGALPKDVAFSAINLDVGQAPVSPGFGRLEGRPRWAIPWFEDDPALIAPQLWVGRMRKDAADALAYGCTGLMGLHWRTRVLGPNIGALARAAWDQKGWGDPAPETPSDPGKVSVLGGQVVSFPGAAVAGTDRTPLYRDVRFDLDGYRVPLPAGKYAVTLRFCEPAYNAAGKRVFGVKLQGRTVLEHLDVFARAGANRALDLSFSDIEVSDGWLRIDFIREVEFPCIAAFSAEGPGGRRAVNCGGPAFEDFEADPAPAPRVRFLPVLDFYRDWAAAHFGPKASEEAAAIFAGLDGRFPRPCDWNLGPGVISVNPAAWEAVEPGYRFAGEFARLRPKIRGAGNLERFDWWLETFRFARAMARLGCARGELDRIIARIDGELDREKKSRMAREEALPLRLALVPLLGEMVGHLLATLHNTSEMGMIVNVEQQSMLRAKLLTVHDEKLAGILGGPLPPEARPWKEYRGPPRLIVPTRRPSLAAGEPLRLKVIALAPEKPVGITAFWRPLGRGEFSRTPLAHRSRGVYEVVLPAPTSGESFEYYVEMSLRDGTSVRYPTSAPVLNLTVVIDPLPQ
jgi:hypothetical protein